MPNNLALSPKMKQQVKSVPMNTLFDFDIPKNQEPIEDVEITTTILYMSKAELREFKKLAKIGVKEVFGQEFQQKGNLTDFLLYLLRKNYGDWKEGN